MASLGYDPNVTTTDYAMGSAAALGNHIAQCYIAFGFVDGSNEAGNHALEPEFPGSARGQSRHPAAELMTLFTGDGRL